MANLFTGGAPRTNSTQSQKVTALRVQQSVDGTPIPIVWGQNRIAGNLIDYQDFKAISAKSSSKGGKGGSTSAGQTWNYTVAVDVGLCEGPISSILQMYNNQTAQTLASLGFTAFLGSYTQSAWSYMTTNHSANALDYRGLCHVASAPLALGSSPELSNYNFELLSTFNTAISGMPDAQPADVVNDFLTNVNYGVGFPSAQLGSLSVFSNYCLAAGIVISPVLKDQTPAADFLTNIAAATNSAFRWSAGVLDLIPYGDVNLSANGGTYTAPSPQFTFTLADLLPLTTGTSSSTSGGPGPVQIDRGSTADQYNLVRIRYLDRTNNYQQQTVTAYDEASITASGLRQQDPIDYSFICVGSIAQTVGGLQLGRMQVRNKYTFVLGRRFIRLDPMDLVQLPDDATLGLSGQIVRITEITENTDNTLTILAEETLQGAGHVASQTPQINSGYIANYNADPGSVNTPIIFVPPGSLTQGNLEVWVALSGVTPSVWGGAYVWASTDGTTYKQIGTMTGASRMGTLTAGFASHADPDTTDTLSVDLTESQGAISSGTSADADNFNTLCYVDGELISYQTATLTSAYHYNIGTRIRRGLYGTTIGAHSSATLFARLDDAIGEFPFTADRIAAGLHFKFQSFNIWGGGTQDISTVTAYAFTVSGLPTAYSVSGLAVSSSSFKSLALTWTLPANANLSAIEIWRSPNSTFASAALVATVSGTTNAYVDDGLASNTTFWYYVRCRDIAGNNGAYDPVSGGSGVSGTTQQIQTGDIAAGAITAATLAASLTVPQVVSSLASISSPVQGDLAFLTTDNQLYRYTGSAWTLAVPAVNITGTIVNAQIGAAAVEIANFASNISPPQIQIDRSHYSGTPVEGSLLMITNGDSPFVKGQLLRYTSGAWVADVPAIAITGTLTDAQLSAIAAAKITGTITTTQITNSAITTPKIAAGNVTTNEIAANTITASNIAAATITATQIAAGTITATQIAAGTITASNIAANTITAGQIAAAAIGTTQLAANAITASKLFVGGVGSALNTDPAPSDINAWTLIAGSTGLIQTGLTDGQVGSTSLRSQTGVGFDTSATALIPLDQTKTYRIRCWWRGNSSSNGQFSLIIQLFDGSGANIPSSPRTYWAYAVDAFTNNTNVWQQGIGVFGAGTGATFPPTARTMRPIVFLNDSGTAGYQEAQDIRIEEVLPGTLIQDGSITTTKIGAAAVEAGQIAANAVTAGTIDANAVTAGTIAAGAINVGTEIVNNLIVTGHIVNGAVTTGLQLSASSVSFPSSGADTTVLSGSFTASGNSVLVLCSGHFNKDCYFELKVDSTVLLSGYSGGVFTLNSQGYPGMTLFTAVSAASHTFTFHGYDNTGTGAAVTNAQLIVMDWQR